MSLLPGRPYGHYHGDAVSFTEDAGASQRDAFGFLMIMFLAFQKQKERRGFGSSRRGGLSYFEVFRPSGPLVFSVETIFQTLSPIKTGPSLPIIVRQ